MAVSAEGLSKSFAGVSVLHDVDIAVASGKVHALLGANGSGKSTLVKILSGVYQPDGGRLTVGNHGMAAIKTPFEANALGIAVVHQEAPLIDTLSVAENMAVYRGYPRRRGGRVDWHRLKDDAETLLARYAIAIDPDRLAGVLSPAERALVALVVALDRVQSGLELLILDEVTASLQEDQAKVYLDRVRQIAAGGASVLMVTHRLAELHGLAHGVTVLRGGQRVYEGIAGELRDEALVGHMIGPQQVVTDDGRSRKRTGAVRRLWAADAKDDASPMPGTAPALAVRDLHGRTIHGLSFGVAAGEIVGVAGLVDSGAAELPELLGGVVPRRSGDILVAGRAIPRQPNPGTVMAAGLAVLPADRLRNGGIPTLSVAENVLLPNFDGFWHRTAHEEAVLDRVISEFDVRPPSSRILFGKLSGGNQQKCILAKWLLTRPQVLVLDDPTSGVDPAAREKIFEILNDATAEGVGILLFSTEPEQLATLCGRVIVLRKGQAATELRGDGLTRKAISEWCYA